jgi:outer membrane lipoprotein carrier protein
MVSIRNKTGWALLWMAGILVMGLSMAAPGEATGLSAADILSRVENRYAGRSFTARFSQESLLKAMEITDTAAGQVFVKYPGKMRWEYERPEKQIMITDGKRLWIYRLAENQVMTGQAPEIIGDGRGASFLSDLKLLRKKFRISLAPTQQAASYTLVLHPLQDSPDLSSIELKIDRSSFDIREITTLNAYGDRTRIAFHDIRFVSSLADRLFSFTIPKGADVVRLDEGQ